MKPKKEKPGPKTGSKSKKMKHKRWRKGHSSDSNPEIKRHREAAKSRFFNQNTGTGGLTMDALAKHDEILGDKDSDMLLDAASDGGTGGGKTVSSWATNWTDCTNTTFSKVHRFWNSKSALHKEILAILAAVTEVIKTKGGKETETEYFAALMTALETVEEENSKAAVAYLLSLALKRVPPSVLKARFSDISKVFLDVLAAHVTTDAPALLRSVILCLGTVLRVQEQAVWNNASTLQVYSGLLTFTVHTKPKVRKAAQEAVRVILKGSVFMTCGDPPPHHPAASTTAKFCIQQIEEAGGTGEASATLYTLELMKNVLGIMPHNSLKSSCETILRVMTLSNVLVTSVAMRALHGMFTSQPKPSSLPAELNAQIITALYDFQPGENDVQPMTAWLVVMQKAHTNLARLDKKLCLSHLPRLFASCMACMHAEKSEVQQAAANALKTVLKDCVAPVAEDLGAMLRMAPTSTTTPVHKMFKSVEAGLGYQYHSAWALVLQVLAVFFEILGKHCYPIMKQCLLSMADLRDSFQFPYKAELDYAIGAAVRTMGPRQVLEAVPLQITGEDDDYDFPRSWIVPVLRDNIRETELAFFANYFLPLAAKLRTKSLEFAKEGKVVESKTYDVLQEQIWSLLPGFCIRPTDVKESFKGIARILGTAISDRPDLRLEVMASLRKLISQNLNNEENLTELSRFAKNYLPLLFNLFTTQPEKEKDPMRLAVLETTRVYVQIADKELVASFFEKCFSKLLEEDTSGFRRHALMDLALVMIPHIDKSRLVKLWTHLVSQLESTDHTIQKKCYRGLEEMCGSKSADSKAFIAAHLADLQNVLTQSLSSSSPSSKAPRLRCLKLIFDNLEQAEMEFLRKVIPEAILCTKEVAERARMASYGLLVAMGEAMLRWSPQIKSETVATYLRIVMAGLAGSPHMISTTLLATTRLLITYKDDISSDLLKTLVDNVCLLLQSRAREVVDADLGLLKVILALFKDTDLAQFLSKIVESLVLMKDDSRHHFRFKSKDIFTRLVRKFGYETIHSMVPTSLHKVLANIRKTQERAKRKKAAGKKDDDDSSDEEDGFAGKPHIESIDDLLRDSDSDPDDDGAAKVKGQKKKANTSKTRSAWLQEGGEEEIVDFLDPSVSKKVVATKPGTGAQKKTSIAHDFKMAPDGRLIITDEEEADNTKPKKGKGGKDGEPLIDDIDELLEAMEGGAGKKQKKRKLAADNMDDEDDKPMKYQAGGSGIHRPLAKAPKEKLEPGAEYRAKKAGGDMKRKDKPDPFAYVPLEFTTLNRRKKAKLAGRFNNLVKGARKGASKGQKMRNKKR